MKLKGTKKSEIKTKDKERLRNKVERNEIILKLKKNINKRCIIQSKNKVNEQFGLKMNEDVNGNKKLFWQVSNVKGGKVDGLLRYVEGED